jgi:hypothetical protein
MDAECVDLKRDLCWMLDGLTTMQVYRMVMSSKLST